MGEPALLGQLWNMLLLLPSLVLALKTGNNYTLGFRYFVLSKIRLAEGAPPSRSLVFLSK